ncbi:MAG: FAD-dependent oxidoreductase [Candidatus Cloacimonetes bacterium]|nr:FAD-dependent oxidoreductase [Candidatus Cloacimonadota bacterium]
MINIILNGKKIQTEAGKTILQVATEQGIKIPTLCHDPELSPTGSCWVCAVQVSNRKGFVTACGTQVLEGMEITTDSEEVREARKMALELLLSDHYADCEAPCRIACPDQVDVQTYVSLIANGQYHEAIAVIKETLPMPLSIGRVCPAFCEQECRRKIVEEPVAIRQLKRFAADYDLQHSNTFVPGKLPAKNRKVAVVGGGPSGLTCGYYLSNNGYDVTVFEGAPKAGGWLRYGIPEYRLPKKILDQEIKLMCRNGMKIKTDTLVGIDITLSELSRKFDAVYLAMGAQNAVPMNIEGSDLKGCYLGVDFLKDYVMGKITALGSKIAVIGGGNTAVDCARTARRLGADVTIIYRRTRKEMPAEAYEVDAAEEEGIKMLFLTNPVQNIGKKGKLTALKLEKMKLGEPDASGRCRPEPTGEFFVEEFDTMIAAISQAPEVNFLADEKNKIEGKVVPLTRWSTAVVDEETMHIGLANLFAGGDFRRGPATAIEAIADGRIAAQSIDRYLSDKMLIDPVKLFDAKKELKLKDVDPEQYAQYPRINRYRMPELESGDRIKNFREVELGFSEQEARAEAARCLECGCLVNSTCDLRKYATEYGINLELFRGDKNKHPIDSSHPFIQRDPNKCIKCGRCVRICAEVQGPGVLGYIYRGFSTYVAPEFGDSLTYTTCESCGKCIEVCPVGALLPRNINYKLNPHELAVVQQNCGLCGTGCAVDIHVQTDKVAYINPSAEEDFNRRNLCFAGKFGWQMLENQERILVPYKRVEASPEKVEDCWEEFSTPSELINLLKEKISAAGNKRIYLAPSITNEEILMLKTIAKKMGAQLVSLSRRELFTDQLLNTALYPKDYTDLEAAEAIVIIGKLSPVLKTLCRIEQRKGKKLYIITNENRDFNRFADELFTEEPMIDIIDRILENYYDEEDPDLDSEEEDSEKVDALEPIQLDLPTKTLFLYNIDLISEELIRKIWYLAGIVCDFSQGSGVFATSLYSNLNGILRFNVKSGKPERADFSMLYAELPGEEQRKIIKNSKFIVSVNTHIDESDPAHVILPLPSYLDINGSAIANDWRTTHFHNPRHSDLFESLLHLFEELGLLTKQQAQVSYWQKEVETQLQESRIPEKMTDQQLIDLLDGVEDVNLETPKYHQVQKIQLDILKKITRAHHN